MSSAIDIETSGGGPLQVAQALHGYRNGHELLAASLPLTKDGDRALLELSDLSGSAARTRGFESYITGYPVPGEHLYAFARTWLATGSGRPGSVWTHTLLLTPEQLELQGVANLANSFRRPLTLEQASDYESPLVINTREVAEPLHRQVPSQLTRHSTWTDEILEALYSDGSSTVPILVPAASSSEYEELLLHIWSLQWPELRERFSFCTGSLSLRQVAGRPYDLQVIPQDRAIARDASSGGYVLIEGHHIHPTSTTWTDDLRPHHDVMPQARTFTWRLGPELEPERLSFGRLAQIHRLAQDVSNPSDWQSLLEVVREWYPRRSSARALKSWALDESGSSPAGRLTNLDRLSVLSRLTGVSAFPGWGRSLATAFSESLLEPDPEFGVFLSEFPAFATAPAREALLRLSDEHLDADAFTTLIRSSPEDVALKGLDLRPSIVGHSALWRSESARRKALTWLPASEIDEPLLTVMVRAVVAADQPVGLRDLSDCAGDLVIDAAFDVLGEGTESSGALQASPEWLSTLRGYPERGVSWLARGERPSAVLSRFVLERLRPEGRQTRALTSSRWVEIVRSIDPYTAEGSSVHAFALGVGFHDKDPSASSLVAEVFQTVHQLAEEGRLDDEDWDKLEFVLPGSRWLLRLTRDSGPGRARTLRRAVVEAFERRDWPVATFLEAVRDTALLATIVTENIRTWSGRALGRRLRVATQSGSIVLSDLQRAALDPWIDSPG